MGLINHLFRGREAARKFDASVADSHVVETAPVGADKEGNRSFTYRPTDREGVKPTQESHGRNSLGQK